MKIFFCVYKEKDEYSYNIKLKEKIKEKLDDFKDELL